MSSPSTTPPAAPSVRPSISRPAQAAPQPRGSTHARIGDTVLVKLDADVVRPMIVTFSGAVQVGPSSEPTLAQRVSGSIFCEPEDHSTPAFRTSGNTSDPARIHGRPERTWPVAYGEYLKEGVGIGEWQPRPTNLPAKG